MNLKIEAEFKQYRKLVLGRISLDKVVDNILRENYNSSLKHKPKSVISPRTVDESEPDTTNDHVGHNHDEESDDNNDYRVTSPYGMRTHPIKRTKKFHYGIDLGASEGSPIYAGENGVVSAVGYNKDSGYYVEINHGEGLVSSYSHLSTQNVKQGQSVGKGAIIGAVGKTGSATGPHLHFAIKLNGRFVDPTGYVNKWRIL